MDKQNLITLVTALSTGEGLISDELRMLLDTGVMEDLPDSLRGNATQNFALAFEAMGGLPRLLLYADRSPGAFYKLYARLLKEAGASPDLPPAPPTWLDRERLTYDVQPGAEKEDDDE